jgi:hypothetical protein
MSLLSAEEDDRIDLLGEEENKLVSPLSFEKGSPGTFTA